MSAPTCIRCGKPMPDTAYACVHCGITKPGEQLRDLADMVGAARDIAHGLSRRGGGAASGKPGSRLPLDLLATQKLDEVQNELVTWARHILSERGGDPPLVGFLDDAILLTAQWLPQHLEWLRHRQEAAEALATIDACARVVAGIARGPAELKFLGPCGADVISSGIDSEGWPADVDIKTCEGDVYAREGASVGRCRVCGTEWSTAERRAWLDEQVRDKAFRAAHIGDAYGINVNTIRTWAAEVRAENGTLIRAARLKSYYRVGEGDDVHVVPWTEPAAGEDVKARGPRLHYVGDVLDLAREAAARRAESEARRNREGAAA
jgi:hypothetical protein